MFILEPEPSPDVGEATKEVVEGTIDILAYTISTAVGVFVGLIIAFIVLRITKVIARRHVFTRLLVRRVAKPFYVTCAVWCGRVGLVWFTDIKQVKDLGWLAHIDHVLIIATILCLTWLLASAVQVIEDITDVHFKDAEDVRHKGRIATQAQLLRRLGQATVIILGVSLAILTFPAARVTVASLLGAAGLMSVVVAVAAQTTLGNVFAGLQLAITDAIRVGDVVLVPGLESAKEMGRIEEITLTYVVLALWDNRRIIIPSSEFTNSKFENWTKRQADMLGTIELHLDYSAPITQIRERVDALLNRTDLWDGRTANVQITDSSDTTMLVRVVVSAADSGRLWDLRCYMREELIAWINAHAAFAWPRQRFQGLDVQRVEEDLSDLKIAELAEELAHISGREIGQGHSASTADIPAFEKERRHKHSDDPVHNARLKAAKQRAIREQVRKGEAFDRGGDAYDSDQTTVMDANQAGQAGQAGQVARKSIKPSRQRKRRFPLVYRYYDSDTDEATPSRNKKAEYASSARHRSEDSQEHTTGNVQTRLFSGTPDADARGEALHGPGQEAWADRERQAAELKAQRVREAAELEAQRVREDADRQTQRRQAEAGIDAHQDDNQEHSDGQPSESVHREPESGADQPHPEQVEPQPGTEESKVHNPNESDAKEERL